MTATRGAVALLAAVALGAAACNREAPPPPPATTESPAEAPPTERVVGPLSETDAAALATMNDRLKDYVDLHRKLEARAAAAAERGDAGADRQESARLRADARSPAPGRQAGRVLHARCAAGHQRLLETVFGGPDGKQLKASIMDENPVA